jgi:hypothetical protein
MPWAKNRPVAGTPEGLPARLFPSDNWWNLKITNAPVDPNSAALIEHERTYGGREPSGNPTLRYDWGDNYGMPYCTVSGDYPKITFNHVSYSAEHDHIGYPIPIEALTQPGWTEDLQGTINKPVSTGDRHIIIVDVDNQILYEVYQPFHNGGTTPVTWGAFTVQPGQWACASGAHWDMKTNATRPDGWTSSDAAGLQVLPGLAKYDEICGSVPITHAHRVCLYGNTSTPPLYVWPATHHAGSWNPGAAPLGTRFRLKAGFDINAVPGVGANGRRLLQSLKDYGLIFADNGGHGMVTGTNDARWGNYESAIRIEMVYALQAVKITDLEVIQLGWKPDGPIVIPPDPPDPPEGGITLDEALATIARIEAELTTLKAQVVALEASHSDDAAQIAALTTQVAELTAALQQVHDISGAALGN